MPIGMARKNMAFRSTGAPKICPGWIKALVAAMCGFIGHEKGRPNSKPP
jgi:hypothetical protein